MLGLTSSACSSRGRHHPTLSSADSVPSLTYYHSWTAPCIIINEGTNAANLEATSPTGTIAAKAGDQVVLDWQQWPDSHIGGMAVYMAVSLGIADRD